MGNSKVIFGNETLIDLTGDTVTPDTLLAGTTAHNRSGEQIVGTATVPEELDDLTDVTLTSPAEGDLLQYDDASGKWVNSAKIPQKVSGLQKTGCVNVAPNKATSQTISNIAYTVNADGSVSTNNNTATAKSYFTIFTSKTKFKPRKYYLSGCPSGGGFSAFALYLRTSTDGSNWSLTAGDIGSGAVLDLTEEKYIKIEIYVENGASTGGKTFYPMLALIPGLPYQPYSMTNRELTEVAVTRSELNLTKNTDIITTNSAIYATTYGKLVYVIFDVNIKTAGLTNPIIATGLPKPYKNSPSYGFTSIGLQAMVTTEGLKIFGTPQTGWVQGSIIYLID